MIGCRSLVLSLMDSFLLMVLALSSEIMPQWWWERCSSGWAIALCGLLFILNMQYVWMRHVIPFRALHLDAFIIAYFGHIMSLVNTTHALEAIQVISYMFVLLSMLLIIISFLCKSSHDSELSRGRNTYRLMHQFDVYWNMSINSIVILLCLVHWTNIPVVRYIPICWHTLFRVLTWKSVQLNRLIPTVLDIPSSGAVLQYICFIVSFLVQPQYLLLIILMYIHVSSKLHYTLEMIAVYRDKQFNAHVSLEHHIRPAESAAKVLLTSSALEVDMNVNSYMTIPVHEDLSVSSSDSEFLEYALGQEPVSSRLRSRMILRDVTHAGTQTSKA